MDNPHVEIKGLNRLVRDLKRLSGDVVIEIRAVNLDLAGDVAATGRSLAPKRTRTLAGDVRAGATQRSGVVRAGRARIPYAGPIHFGWPARNITAQPFLWLAVARHRAEIERRWTQALTTLVERIN